jgi:hypothetical protein
MVPRHNEIGFGGKCRSDDHIVIWIGDYPRC